MPLESPPFSVVVPLYNKQAEIARTLRSVFAQTVPADEVIVVNDGSTDGSRTVVASFEDSRIRIVDQRNRGECAARNTGIREARNDWIAFLDADDEWLPEHLEEAAGLLRDFPEAEACSSAFYFQTSAGRRLAPARGVPSGDWGVIPDFFHSQFLVWSSGAVIRKSAFEAAGVFREGAAYAGDADMWLRLGAYVPIAYSSRPTSVYHTDASNRVCDRPAMRRTLFIRRSLAQIEQDPSLTEETKRGARGWAERFELMSAHLAHRRGFVRQARRAARVYAAEFGRTPGWVGLRLKLLTPPAWSRAWARLRWG